MRTFSLITVFLLALGVFAVNASEDGPYTEITAEELASMQSEEENLVVIDSRGGKYFDGELIKGAVQLSVKETDADTLGKVVPSKDHKVVFYCSNTACQASALSAFKADRAGYKHLFKYPGGIEDWKEKGLPTVMVN